MSEIPRGAIRFNTDSNKPELWDGSQWAEFQLSTPNLGTNLTPTGSVYFNGSAYVTVPTSTDFGLVEGNWTVECYAYIEQMVGSYGRLWYLEGSSAADIDGVYFSNTHMSMGSTNVWSIGDGTGGEYERNRWMHVAVCHDSTNIRMYINGHEAFTSSNNFFNSASKKLTLMSTNNGSYGGTGQGYISNFRIVNGTALYTSNFTPPSAPLTNVTNTKLLFCQSATSATAAAVTPNTPVSTSATASSFGPFNSDKKPGTRGLFGGGQHIHGNSISNVIDYVNISSQGKALDFGDLSSARRWVFGAVASRTRGVWAGGLDPAINDTIDFVTIASTGNATDFGNQVDSKATYGAVCNETRGVFGGGNPAASSSKTAGIDYITIASTGNSVNFGNLETATASLCGAAGQVRGLFFGGYTPTVLKTIQFVTISTLGDSQNFGDLARTNGQEGQACANATRGICSGGTGPSPCTDIEYVNIASGGNGNKFGDLTSVSVSTMGAVSSPTRGVISTDDTNQLNLDMIEIMTEGNSIDFGDLSVARDIGSGCSNGHGGL